jgi:hypothetical protein
MLLMPAPVPCMNHYAVECNDADAIGRLGMEVVGERPEASVFGVGRHIIGSNIFWYLLDPAGGMFELFTDMDQITDDELWAAQHKRLTDAATPLASVSVTPAAAGTTSAGFAGGGGHLHPDVERLLANIDRMFQKLNP